MRRFDIAPFALPNCPQDEVWFEEPRDIECVEVTYAGQARRRPSIYYLQRNWPDVRLDDMGDADLVSPAAFGWTRLDDWFHTEWRKASARTETRGRQSMAFTFQPLTREPGVRSGLERYDVTFRRTLAVRVGLGGKARVRTIKVFTRSPLTQSRLRVELDAGRRTQGGRMTFRGYNAVVDGLRAGQGVGLDGAVLRMEGGRGRSFEMDVTHMEPAHRYCGDDGLVTFDLGKDAFTVSLAALTAEGPVWYARRGVYVAFADDVTSFADYRARIKGQKTIAERVLERPEQSLAGAFHGQPRPHAVACTVGCKHARQRFWIEPNGDVVLTKGNVTYVPASDTPRFKNDADGRVFFGLERWGVRGRFCDPAPVPVYNFHVERDGVVLEQKLLAVPLMRSILSGPLWADERVVALVRFRFRNAGARATTVELPVEYSGDSARGENRFLGVWRQRHKQDDNAIPMSPREELAASRGRLTGRWHGQRVLRLLYETPMRARRTDAGIVLRRRPEPGQTCEAVLKIPYIGLDRREELEALQGLDFETCYQEVAEFWRGQGARGARVRTPDPRLNALHASHLTHVMMADVAMPKDEGLINTSVGMSTYGNYCNESCMIIRELDTRGLHEEARRRLELFIKYQGTMGLQGAFTDHDGVYYGSGGFEGGSSYVQHHGWVLWTIAEHYFLTGDAGWFRAAADSVLAAVDWIARQRRQTMAELPHSRGVERGLLPAGGLEDATDYGYWIATDALTWRGVRHAAEALRAVGHPQAERVRREADDYRRDLLRAVKTASAEAPLVRLRDARWVPHFPSRLYRRGRDIGWIREVLGGSIYLLLSGLYDPASDEASWILDDYEDNRYVRPPYGYPIVDVEQGLFDRGGFSIQPNLVAGLIPHLERDEPELYLRMFFNAWAACYREEINAMVEHPLPELGFANSAHPKTSDEANAVLWLRSMFVCAVGDVLHLGRAIPRAWLKPREEIWAEGVATPFGRVGVRYRAEADARRIMAEADLRLRRTPGRVLVRFRHPSGQRIRSVRVNGRPHRAFDPIKGDVDVTGMSGKLTVEARY